MHWWYYERDNKEFGPVITYKLHNMRKIGEITPSTLIWRKGMEFWQPFYKIIELAKSDPELSAECIHCGERFIKKNMLEISPSVFISKSHKKQWENKLEQDLIESSTISKSQTLKHDSHSIEKINKIQLRFDSTTSAPISKRIFARLLDITLVLLVSKLILKITNTTSIDYLLISMIIIGYIYRTITVTYLQTTIGKKLVGLKIISKNSEKITLKQSIIRSTLEIFSLTSFAIGYIIAFYDKNKQTLHDVIASTKVIEIEDNHKSSKK